MLYLKILIFYLLINWRIVDSCHFLMALLGFDFQYIIASACVFLRILHTLCFLRYLSDLPCSFCSVLKKWCVQRLMDVRMVCLVFWGYLLIFLFYFYHCENFLRLERRALVLYKQSCVMCMQSCQIPLVCVC